MSRRVIINIIVIITTGAWIGLVWASPAFAQRERFSASAQVSSARLGEFDHTDVGVGGRFAWQALPLLGVEAELDLYPGNLPEQRPFSSGRFEGLFGVTVGHTIGRVRPFARVRPGFVSFSESPEPLACIAIFPPPLSCTLAAGRTMFAFDLGGGVELPATPRTFVRIDVGDRLLKYPGPAIAPDGEVHTTGFTGHSFRFSAGGGLRF